MQLAPMPIAVPEDCTPEGVSLHGRKLMVMAFTAVHDDKKFYAIEVCGRLEIAADELLEEGNLSDKMSLSWHGGMSLGAFSAFLEDSSFEGMLFFKQVLHGPTSVESILEDTFSRLPNNTAVVFVGDFSGELNGKIAEVINESIKSQSAPTSTSNLEDG